MHRLSFERRFPMLPDSEFEYNYAHTQERLALASLAKEVIGTQPQLIVGYKASNGGRDKSQWAHDQYTGIKTIWIDAQP